MKKTGLYLLVCFFLMLCGCGDSNFISRPCSSDPAEIAAYSLPTKYLGREKLIIPQNLASSAALADCDGDGTDELVVCTASDSSSDPRVSIRVFSESDGEFVPLYSVSNYGTVIDNLSFIPFEDGSWGIVFGWGPADSPLHEINIFGFTEKNPKLLYRGVYDRLELYDIDDDGQNELLLMTAGSDDECGHVSLLSYANGRISVASTVPLSAGLTKIEASSVGNVGFKLGALLCEGLINGRGYVTDCIVSVDGELVNLFYSESSCISQATLRPLCVWSRDIDGDGCIEIPSPHEPADNEESTGGRLIDWMRPGADGSLNSICTSYSNFESGWYLILPDGAGVDLGVRVTVDRDDVKCTLFTYGEDGRDVLWAVYEFIGEKAAENMKRSGLREAAAFHDRIYSVAVYKVLSPLKYSTSSLASDLHLDEKYINGLFFGTSQ